MARKVKNKALGKVEAREYAARAALHCEESVAKEVAKAALQDWYTTSYERANAIIPKMQIDSNLKEVASIPGWQEQKGPRNGYVMLTTLLAGIPRPTILVLDYECEPTGGLTYRQLHQQIREALRLEPKVSLRMCPFRPWHSHGSFPFPEQVAFPATDAQCRHLLGTTLLYYTYVHRNRTD